MLAPVQRNVVVDGFSPAFTAEISLRARRYRSEITLRGDEAVDPKDAFRMTYFSVIPKSTVSITAFGEDAHLAVEGLAQLMRLQD